MDVITKANLLGTASPNTYKKLSDFAIGEIMEIKRVYYATTKYGQKLMADTGKFVFFLPNRLNSLTKAEVEKINKIQNLEMKYIGIDDKKSHTVKFQPTPQRVDFYHNYMNSSDDVFVSTN